MDAEQPCGRLARHGGRDRGAPVAALRPVAGVAETLHQLRPGPGDAVGTPARRGRLTGKPVARQRRYHHIECVRGVPAVRGGIGERLDDLQLLDDRAGPPVRDDEWQRRVVVRANMDEMNVEPVDLGQELRQRVQLCLAPPPVVLCRPIIGECLHRGEVHALGIVCDGLPLRQSCRGYAPAQVGQFRLRDIHVKGTNGDRVSACLLCHFSHSFGSPSYRACQHHVRASGEQSSPVMVPARHHNSETATC